MYAAEKSGIAPENLMDKLNTTAHWKQQYAGLSDFKVPSSALLCDVKPDDTVKLYAPLAMPGKRGRKGTKRKDNAYNHQAAAAGKKSAKKSAKKSSRAATPGSSSSLKKRTASNNGSADGSSGGPSSGRGTKRQRQQRGGVGLMAHCSRQALEAGGRERISEFNPAGSW